MSNPYRGNPNYITDYNYDDVLEQVKLFTLIQKIFHFQITQIFY
jgi:hypothetical protein